MDAICIISTEEIIETYSITYFIISDDNANASNDEDNDNNNNNSSHEDTMLIPITITLTITTTYSDITIINNPDEHDINTYTSSRHHR